MIKCSLYSPRKVEIKIKNFGFLNVCDKFEMLGHVQAAMMISMFLPFFLDSLPVTVSGLIGLFNSSCYFKPFSL